jgi:hypothetical protein
VRGQVGQRAEGLQRAAGDMVLQLDDDIHLAEGALSALVTALAGKGSGNVVGPAFFDDQSGKPLHAFPRALRGVAVSLYASVVAGAPWGRSRMGRVTRIGVNYGVDPRLIARESAFATDWLPGGCVLCFRKDVVPENFYPFRGKAYCEDIIHSQLRRARGMRHWVVSSAKVTTQGGDGAFTDTAWRGAMAARYFYTRLVGGSALRARLYGLCLRAHWALRHRVSLVDG